MSSIVDVVAREILDSRGNPTVEADVLLEVGCHGARGGAVGRLHRSERGDRAARRRPQRYLGKGVLRAVENVNTEICEAIIGLDAVEQPLIDQTLIELDGTENKARLGANAHAGGFAGGGKGARRRNPACRCTAISAAPAACSCRCR